MTGLEAILAHIEQEAQAEAQGLLDAAQTEAQATLERAQEEAQRRSQAILEEAQKGADAIRERAESAALLEKRDGLLRCKQQLIREALGQVCQELEQAPAQEYFSLLLELVGRWAQPGDGVLYLNARDLQRLPQGFQEELERIAPQGKIALSPQPRQLESGFVLAYGPVELDCTFPRCFRRPMTSCGTRRGPSCLPRREQRRSHERRLHLRGNAGTRPGNGSSGKKRPGAATGLP